MNKIQGDLIELALDGEFDVIVHGCNCFNTMGKGIALQIKNKIPEAYKADKLTSKGDRGKLGSYTHCTVNNRLGGNLTVINGYTQYNFRKGKNINYISVRKVFRSLNDQFKNTGKTIAYPAIGSGLAGGDWDKIYDIICEELRDVEHYFVEYRK